MEKLQSWLRTQCKERNLSWREASLKAKLNAGSISAIMSGQQPGLETCKKLARLFNISVISVLDMAGHIEAMPNSPFLYDPLTARLLTAFQALDATARLVVVRVAEIAARQPQRDDSVTES